MNERRNRVRTKFIQLDRFLSLKKKKVIKSGDHAQYRLKSEDLKNLGKIMTDESLAFEKMLPDESETVGKMKDLFNYFSCESEQNIRLFFKNLAQDNKRVFSTKGDMELKLFNKPQFKDLAIND